MSLRNISVVLLTDTSSISSQPLSVTALRLPSTLDSRYMVMLVSVNLVTTARMLTAVWIPLVCDALASLTGCRVLSGAMSAVDCVELSEVSIATTRLNVTGIMNVRYERTSSVRTFTTLTMFAPAISVTRLMLKLMFSIDVTRLSNLVLTSMDAHSRFPPVLTACSNVSACSCRVISIRNAPVTIRVVMNSVSILKSSRNTAGKSAPPESRLSMVLVLIDWCDLMLQDPGRSLEILLMACRVVVVLVLLTLSRSTHVRTRLKLLMLHIVVMMPLDSIEVLLQNEHILNGLSARLMMCMLCIVALSRVSLPDTGVMLIPLLIFILSRPVMDPGNVILPPLIGRLLEMTWIGSSPWLADALMVHLPECPFVVETEMSMDALTWVFPMFPAVCTWLRPKLVMAASLVELPLEIVLPSPAPTAVTQPVLLSRVASRSCSELLTEPENRNAVVTNVALTRTVTFVGTSTSVSPPTSPTATENTRSFQRRGWASGGVG